jgi:hypothetical protein
MLSLHEQESNSCAAQQAKTNYQECKVQKEVGHQIDAEPGNHGQSHNGKGFLTMDRHDGRGELPADNAEFPA